MNYNILTNIFRQSDLSSIMKLIEAHKDINLLWFVGRERSNFASSTIYNDEEISYDDMINYLNIIISMNSLKSTSYYCCPFIDSNIEFDKVLEYYEYMIKYKIY